MRWWFVIVGVVGVIGICIGYYLGFFGNHLQLVKYSFSRLPYWQADRHSSALAAFQQSCREISKRPDGSLFYSTMPQAGSVSTWKAICNAANLVSLQDDLSAKAFFEKWFSPYLVTNHLNQNGLFTGYYLPLLNASLVKTSFYQIPIYGMPDNLITVNVKLFQPSYQGKNLVGIVKNNTLQRYPDRAAIREGAIMNHAPILAWVHDEVDVFFAHIQGSLQLVLPNKQQLLLGYAGSNGHPYTAIGNVLIAKNALTQRSVSMQTIRRWLDQHPEQVASVLNKNASYVFFRLLKQPHPIGAENVPVTPERSLAIDTHFLPLGAPIWLVTHIPDAVRVSSPFHQLLIAQDTGGAIRGIVRGDIYWGTGIHAAFVAGQMKQRGCYWILLPRQVAAT